MGYSRIGGASRILWTVGKALVSALVGALVVLIAVFVYHLQSRPDLSVWHEAELDAEFSQYSAADTLEQYLDIELQVFAQLEERVYARIEPSERVAINRYHRGSPADPRRWATNWNRSFELPTEAVSAGVLLLHGMSDSPYSLRSLAAPLHESGAWVLGLRMPGHGTAPSGLVGVTWQDMAAAVRLGVRHLRDKVGDRPLFIVGYSNGGALAVEYAISSLEDAKLPWVEGLILISPAIGVSGMARLALWQSRLGYVLGLDKLSWNSIMPEYDPFKYGSFAVNAGHQSYRLTREIRMRLDALRESERFEQFPAVLAFQSIADATVSTGALIRGLFERLPSGPNELVLYDINRVSEIESLLYSDPRVRIDAMLRHEAPSFSVRFYTNENDASARLVLTRWQAETAELTTTPIDRVWPPGLYSLSHVALAFPVDDPLYGRDTDTRGEDHPVHLGTLALRGERNILRIPASDMLRLRWNPFHEDLVRRLLEFTAPE